MKEIDEYLNVVCHCGSIINLPSNNYGYIPYNIFNRLYNYIIGKIRTKGKLVCKECERNFKLKKLI